MSHHIEKIWMTTLNWKFLCMETLHCLGRIYTPNPTFFNVIPPFEYGNSNHMGRGKASVASVPSWLLFFSSPRREMKMSIMVGISELRSNCVDFFKVTLKFFLHYPTRQQTFTVQDFAELSNELTVLSVTYGGCKI